MTHIELDDFTVQLLRDIVFRARDLFNDTRIVEIKDSWHTDTEEFLAYITEIASGSVSDSNPLLEAGY